MPTTTTDATLLAARLKRLRVNAGFSQNALAAASGLTVSLIAKLEQGLASNPRTDSLVALAKALGVTPNDLIWPARSAGTES